MELSSNFNPRVSNYLINNPNTANQTLLTDNTLLPEIYTSNLTMSLRNDNKVLNNVNLFSEEKLSQKEQNEILKSFKSGLKQYKVSEVYLSSVISSMNLGRFNVTEANIINSDNLNAIKGIQEKINNKITTAESNKFGIAKKLKVNGHFDKTMIQYLLNLNDTQNHGSSVKLEIAPIKQIGHTNCFLTSEAMYFNFMHQKLGKSDAYTEFDTRSRINYEDRRIDNETTPGIISENAAGRVSIKRDKGLNMVNLIDQELTNNKPVIAGVSSRKQEEGKEYNEGITDHFVLITGRNYDQDGVYYTFNDPYAGGKDDKFRLDPLSGKLYGIGDSNRKYDVTDAVTYNPSPVKNEYYKMIGSPVAKTKKNILEIQNDLKRLGYNIFANGKYNKELTNAVKNFQLKSSLPVTGNVDSYTLEKLKISSKR
jgi:hypothetical protein